MWTRSNTYLQIKQRNTSFLDENKLLIGFLLGLFRCPGVQLLFVSIRYQPIRPSRIHQEEKSTVLSEGHTSAISPGKCKVYNSAKQETIRHTPKKSTPEPIKNKEPTLATEPAIKPIKRNLIAEYQEQNSKITELTPSDIPLNTDVTSNVLVKRTTAGSLTSSLLQLKGHWVDWLQDKSSLQSQVDLLKGTF